MPQQEPEDNLTNQLLAYFVLATVYPPLRKMFVQLGAEADSAIAEFEAVLHKEIAKVCEDWRKAIDTGEESPD